MKMMAHSESKIVLCIRKIGRLGTASLLAMFGLVLSFDIGSQDLAGATSDPSSGVWLKEPVGSQVGLPVSLAVSPGGDVLETQGNLVIKLSSDGSVQSSIGFGFNNPCGVAVSASGRVLVADSGNSRVISMNLDGTGLTPIGSGFSYPQGIAVDSNGRVFVADTHNSRIVSMNQDGTDQVTIARNTQMSGSWLQSPTSVALDNSGHLFATDTTTSRVWKMSSSGSDIYLSTVGSNFSYPQGVAVDSFGRVFVADSGNSRVVAVSADGSSQSVIGSGYSYPFAVAVSGTGRLLVADSRHSRIVSLNADGTDQTVLSEGFNYPKGIAVDSDGRLYVADTYNNRVIRMNADGTERVAIGTGFSNPAGVAVDGAGHVYVADLSNNRVVKMNADGSGQTNIGAGFSYPAGVAVDGAGHVYVADSRDNAVVRMNMNGLNILTIPGFSIPSGVAVDAVGRVYVADTGNNRVVAMNSDGFFKSILGTGFSGPTGVAVDPSGRLWVADRNNGRIVSMNTDGTNQSVANNEITSPWSVTTDVQGDIVIVDSENNRIVRLHHALVPAPPAIGAVSGGDAQATVSWTDGADNGSTITAHTLRAYDGQSLIATKTNCPASPCAMTGLANGTSYTFTVSATNDVGEGSPSLASSPVTPATLPGSATNMTVVAAGGAAKVSWTSASENGSPVHSYLVTASPGHHQCSYTVASPEVDGCTVTGLTNGATYSFSAVATNAVGDGPGSTPVSATVQFPAPVLTSLVAAPNQLTLSWTAPTVTDGKITNFTGSAFDPSGHRVATCSGSKSAKKCVITGLTDFITYSVSVTAWENSGGTLTARSNVLTATPASSPTKPFLHAVIATHGGAATVVWGASSSEGNLQVSYVMTIKRADGTIFTTYATTKTSCDLTGLTSKAKYSANVVASTSATDAGWVAPSTSKSVTFKGV